MWGDSVDVRGGAVQNRCMNDDGDDIPFDEEVEDLARRLFRGTDRRSRACGDESR